MPEVKKLYMSIRRVRVVSLKGKFGYYVQVLPLGSSAEYVNIQQWDYLANARGCAKRLDEALSSQIIP